MAEIGAKFTEIKPFIDAQYPRDTRAADADGSKAKTVLKRAVGLTALGPEHGTSGKARLEASRRASVP